MLIRVTLPTHYHSEPPARARAFARVQCRRRRKPPAHKFDFPTELVGMTADVRLYYDPQLGQRGMDLAQQVKLNVEQTYVNCRNYFAIAGQPVNVIIAPVNNQTDGTGGAYHWGYNFDTGGELYCDAAFGNPLMTNGLIVAELTESFMDAQNKGWDCGGSNGEALSRFLAEFESGGPAGALAAFATGPMWDRAGRPNRIDATAPTDQDAISIGCGIVYLYWMMSKGYTAAQITQAGCPDGSLASNYTALTGATNPWKNFSAAVAALSGGVTSDDPWRAAAGVALQHSAYRRGADRLGLIRRLGRFIRHDDGAACGEHAADAVADRDPGIGDLDGGDAAHLADALPQRVHAVHAVMQRHHWR